MCRRQQPPRDWGPGMPALSAVGVDTYSYHRLLGEVRDGESHPGVEPITWEQCVEHAWSCGAEVVAVETCYLEAPGALSTSAVQLLRRPGTMLSWGHPYGLAFGADAAAAEDVRVWLDFARRLDHATMRVVVGHPALREGTPAGRDEQMRRSLTPLRRVAEHAEALGVAVAVENHGDLTAEQLLWLIDEIGSERLGVCFDTVNALRVGDDLLAAVGALAPRVLAVHLKDISAQPWHPRSGPTTVIPGEGVLPLSAVIDVLQKGGSAPMLLVELAHFGPGQADELTMVAASIDAIRGLVGEPPGSQKPAVSQKPADGSLPSA